MPVVRKNLITFRTNLSEGIQKEVVLRALHIEEMFSEESLSEVVKVLPGVNDMDIREGVEKVRPEL